MRAAGEQRLVEVPNARVRGIPELEPAVAAEHGHAFVKVVQGLTLNGDQRVVRTLEGDAVAHVLVDVQQPAEGMGRDDRAERASVRQMHQLLKRLEQGGEELELITFEGGKIRGFGQQATLALGLQDLAPARLRRQPGPVELPQPDKGLVEELDPGIGAVDHDRGGEVFEDFTVGRDVARPVGLGFFGGGEVEGITDALARRIRRGLGDFEEPARAFDHDMVAFSLGGARLVGPRGERPAAALAAQDLPRFGDRVFERPPVHRRHEGRIAARDRRAAITIPYRDRQGIEHAAQPGLLRVVARRFAPVGGILGEAGEVPSHLGQAAAIPHHECAEADDDGE